MRSELNDRINFLENTESLPVESVHLTAEAEEYLFLSDPVPQNADLKIRQKSPLSIYQPWLICYF